MDVRFAALFTLLAASAARADDTCGVEMVHGETPRCLPRCASDADCHPAEGVFCDADWRACAIPNTTVMIPRACPAAPMRDRAWRDSVPIAQGASPSAVVAPDGGILVAFAASGSIRVAHLYARGGAHEPPRVLAASGTEPSLARGADGTLYAAWLAGGRPMIATSRDGDTWSDAIAADAPGDCDDGTCTNARIAASSARGATSAYVSYVPRGGGLRVRATLDRGAAWSRAVTVLDASLGSLAVGADGRVHAIGLGGNALGVFGSAERTVVYAVSADRGASWSRPQIVSARDEKLPLVPPALAIGKQIFVAYVRGSRAQTWDLTVATLDEHARKPAWRRTYVTDACALETLPALAIEPRTNLAHLAWYDMRGGGRFAHATCTPAACTPRGAIGDRPFELSLGARSPGAAVLLVDGRATLHALWAEPADGVLHAFSP